MKEELQQQIRHALEQLEMAAPPHDLPTSTEVWSRLQFRLAWRPRGKGHTFETGALLAALYVLAFVLWTTWSGWLSESLLAVLAGATAAAVFFFLQVSRSFRS